MQVSYNGNQFYVNNRVVDSVVEIEKSNLV